MTVSIETIVVQRNVTIESLVKQRKAQKRPAAVRFFVWQSALAIAIMWAMFMTPLGGGVFPEATTLKSMLGYSFAALVFLFGCHFGATDRELANDWLLDEVGRLESASPGTFHPRVLSEIAAAINTLEPLTVRGVVAIEQKVLSNLSPAAAAFAKSFRSTDDGDGGGTPR